MSCSIYNVFIRDAAMEQVITKAESSPLVSRFSLCALRPEFHPLKRKYLFLSSDKHLLVLKLYVFLLLSHSQFGEFLVVFLVFCSWTIETMYVDCFSFWTCSHDSFCHFCLLLNSHRNLIFFIFVGDRQLLFICFTLVCY